MHSFLILAYFVVIHSKITKLKISKIHLKYKVTIIVHFKAKLCTDTIVQSEFCYKTEQAYCIRFFFIPFTYINCCTISSFAYLGLSQQFIIITRYLLLFHLKKIRVKKFRSQITTVACCAQNQLAAFSSSLHICILHSLVCLHSYRSS